MIFWIYWLTGLILSMYISIKVIKKNRELGYTFLVVLSAGYIVFSNILTPRLICIDLILHQLTIVTGSLIWPFTAQLSDMINEIYGKKKTVYAFAFGYIINLLFVVFILMANQTTPIWSDPEEKFWEKYFLPSGMILLASTISFIICNLIDINIFSFLKEKYRCKEKLSVRNIISFAALRSIFSDVINMICDGFLFSVIAFIFVIPWEDFYRLIISSILFKMILSIVDTPLFIIFRLKIKNEIREK